MLSLLNSFADNLIATVQAEIRWFVGAKKMLVPFVFLMLAFVAVFLYAASLAKNAVGDDSFFNQLLHFSESYLVFNLLYFPTVIIINLWVLNLLKQHTAQQPLNLADAFLKSIGFKFIRLIPFLFVWMFFQLVFVVIFIFIGIGVALSRGHIGKGAIGRLLQAVVIVSVTLTLFLFVTTPGMVFDDLGVFSSFRAMRKNISNHYRKVREKNFIYLSAFAVVYAVIGYLPGKLFAGLGIEIAYYNGTVAGITLAAFFYLIQIKAGQFYLWCKQENLQPAQSVSSAQQTVASSFK